MKGEGSWGNGDREERQLFDTFWQSREMRGRAGPGEKECLWGYILKRWLVLKMSRC